MVRKLGIWFVFLLVGGIFGYVIAKNNMVEFTEDHSEVVQEQIVDQTEGGKYFLVPELNVRFENVAGFTPEYILLGSSPLFYSKEVISLAARDPRFSDCITEGFSSISITATQISANDPVDQVSIGKGKYLTTSGPQAVCWNASNLTVEQQNKDQNIQEYQNQTRLFGTFISSAQAY